jgi:hypothetical protein
MRHILLILLLIVLGLGGCAVTVRSLQPTINTAALSWVEAETRTDPVDDLVRFRKAERDGRASSLLLPVFVLLSLALLLLALATPLPRILKETRLLVKARKKAGHPGRRPGAVPQPWLEQAAEYHHSEQPAPPGHSLPGIRPPETQPPMLSPPPATSWLEDE